MSAQPAGKGSRLLIPGEKIQHPHASVRTTPALSLHITHLLLHKSDFSEEVRYGMVA
jgi:hypothetical protein